MNCYRNKPFDTNSLQFFLYNITCYKIPSKSDDSVISPVAQKEHMESLCDFCQVAYSSISCSSIISSSHSGWNLLIHSLNVISSIPPLYCYLYPYSIINTTKAKLLFFDEWLMKDISDIYFLVSMPLSDNKKYFERILFSMESIDTLQTPLLEMHLHGISTTANQSFILCTLHLS